MAKKPLKKAAAKKVTKTAVKKTESKPGKAVAKKTVRPANKAGAKKTSIAKGKIAKRVIKTPVVRKPLTDRELDQRAANVIANSENKKSPAKSKRPKKSATTEQTSTLLDAIVEGMREKKAKNIVILNLSNLEHRVTDYFVISDADSKTHVESIADSVEEIVEKLTSEKAYHSEGKQNGEWVLVDYINIVAHVFLKEFRDLYNLEALWGDAEITLINN